MTVVVGTAGHIDHGKTTLLRALTGIDADRLPEERARGMTIDVGYAHLQLEDGAELDFVDVPGHDRLVGNMLVGAGEIDAVMLIVAADDGPRAQTREHLDLLDGLAIRDGLAIVTKVDGVSRERAAEVVAEVAALLARTTLAGSPILTVSSLTGAGIDELKLALANLRDRVEARAGSDAADRDLGSRLAIDRVFVVRGRGTVVTGTLRGTAVEAGMRLRVEPGGGSVRIREVQVHGRAVARAAAGRVALNVAAGDATPLLVRGAVLTSDAGIVATDRLLVALQPAGRLSPGARTGGPAHLLPADRARVSVHLGTARSPAVIGRSGRETVDLDGDGSAAILRLDRPIAAAPGDRFVLRRESPPGTLAGGRVLDPDPPRGLARRRATTGRIEALASAAPRSKDWHRARLDLHGAVTGPPATLAEDVATALDERLITEATARPSLQLAELVRHGTAMLRRSGILGGSGPGAKPSRPGAERGPAAQMVAARIEALVDTHRLARSGDRVQVPGARIDEVSAELVATMDRLVRLLDRPDPPSLARAAQDSGCPAVGIRRLEQANRILRVEDDLAWATTAWEHLARRAVQMATSGPVTPAALRDATGTSRKYVMALLEDLDRRAILRRTDAGHVPGPRVGQFGEAGGTQTSPIGEPSRDHPRGVAP